MSCRAIEETIDGVKTGRVSADVLFDTINVVDEPELRCSQFLRDCITECSGTLFDFKQPLVPSSTAWLERIIQSTVFDEGRSSSRHLIDEDDLTAIILERDDYIVPGEDGLSAKNMAETLYATIAPRTILIQLIGPLTVWAVFALQTSGFPLFVQCEDLAKRLPPHIISIFDAYEMVRIFLLLFLMSIALGIWHYR
jgi:hypothetical protein